MASPGQSTILKKSLEISRSACPGNQSIKKKDNCTDVTTKIIQQQSSPIDDLSKIITLGVKSIKANDNPEVSVNME